MNRKLLKRITLNPGCRTTRAFTNLKKRLIEFNIVKMVENEARGR